LRDDPAGYLAFVVDLLDANRFDVLLPTHEQGFLFARAAKRLEGRAGFALPAFEDYRIAHAKASFSRLLGELRLPQPLTSIVTTESALRAAVRFPAVIKTSIGTASRGIWFVRDTCDLDTAVSELAAIDAFTGEVLVQEWIDGTVEKAQSVFCRGRLLGFHAYRQVAAGVGGGEAIKESVSRPAIRMMLERIGERLAWHGALSIDYLMADHDTTPRLIDCNPRLVEPMSAYLAGSDLVDLLLRVSRGERPAALPESRAGVRTHLAMQAMLGLAARGGTRRALAGEAWRLFRGREPYAGSHEELTPVASDRLSAVPLAITATLLLGRPKSATLLARSGFGAHLLNLDSIQRIEGPEFE
jgi:predicted ATP-grasp superfamily ATP-dependent carboligase